MKDRLVWDVLVDAGKVDVRVEDDVVYLSGEVASSAERSHAIYDATIEGTGRVDASGLNVVRWTRSPDFLDTEDAATDEDVKSAVAEALETNPRVDEETIAVSVSDGTVELVGLVDNLSEKQEAERVAKNIQGVKEVRNEVVVKNAAAPTDAELGSRVRSAMQRDAYLDAYEIEANVEEGEVILSGTVDTAYEKARAELVAARVNGVTQLENNIRVDDPTTVVAYDPYIDYWDWRDLDWWEEQERNETAAKTDAELVEAIEGEYFWSPFVDGEDISIMVEGGSVTLSGTADTVTEAQAAESNALEAGAEEVLNNIIIQ